MKKTLPILFTTLIFVFVFAVSQSTALAEKVELKGYLIDKASYGEFLKYEDVEAKAKEYTKEDALSKKAKKSGYGILVGLDFYPFDAKGDKLAYQLIENSYKQKGFTVVVKGYKRAKYKNTVRESINTMPEYDGFGNRSGAIMPTTTREHGSNINLGDKNAIEVDTLEEASLSVKEEVKK